MPDHIAEAKQAYEAALEIASRAIQRANRPGLPPATKAYAFDYATMCIENSQRAFAYYITLLSGLE